MSSGALTLTIPAATAAALAARSPKSISAATQSVGISINGAAPLLFNATPTSAGCALVSGATSCTFALTAPVGSDAFAITTYSGVNGGGAILDQAAMTFVVVANVRFSFNVTLGAVVSTTDDSGPGSLRGAIAQANPGDTITFLPGVSGTIALTSGAITLARNVALSGPGAANLTVSGGNSSQIFIVSAGVTATISGLTLANGKGAANGGAISNSGTLAITNCTFTANTAPQANGEGGAVYNAAAATLSVSNSTFSANTAQLGGAIESESANTTITGTTFRGNIAIGPTGAALPFGGAIFSDNDITIANSTFTGNVCGGNGVGYCAGGAINENAFTVNGLTISNSQFTSNQAGVPSKGDQEGDGGAIADGSGGTMTLTGDTFGGSGTGNIATGTGFAYGGAIYDYGTSIVLGAGTAFLSNSATALNAGSASLGGAIMDDSFADGGGTSGTGDLTFTSATTFANNSASAGGSSVGGAIDDESGGAIDLHAANGTTFSGNTATASDSGGYADGGAIRYLGTGTPGCCAVARRPEHGVGPGRTLSSGARRRALAATSYTINGATFTSNGITGGSAPVANVTGGAVDVEVNTSPVTITNSAFTGNTASDSATSPTLFSGGGAISESGATMILTGDQITNNTAGQAGGGVLVDAQGTMTITNCTITGNHVINLLQGGAGGGGVFGDVATLTITGTTISGNTVSSVAAGSGGGGVALWTNTAETATITNSTISGNTSSVDGGGIENLAPYNLILTNVTVYGNSANAGNGGNFFNDSGATIQNSIFAGGSAGAGPDVDTPGILTTSGYNWIQTNVVGAFSPVVGDQVNAGSPQLSAAGLQNNGGPTQTIADALTSPVTHAIPFAGGVCGASGPATDQRGYTRGTTATCDIGAYEFSGVP